MEWYIDNNVILFHTGDEKMPRGGHRAGAGRKATAAGVMHTRAIRFSDSEWAKVEESAKRLVISVSEYIRQTVLKHLD
jgi:hypothetical protein